MKIICDRTTIFGLFILSIPSFVPLLHKLLRTHCYLLRELKDKLDETNKKKHVKQEQEVGINNIWSELDPNLLGEILDRLCLADQLRFHVVCKNWLHTHPITTVKKPLLWYLSFDRSLSEFQLYHPSSSDPASVQHISSIKLGIPSPPKTGVGATLLDHNWLFICFALRNLDFWECKYILLISPFTRKVITLPKFDYPCSRKYFRVTSSTQPDSPDCVFFCLTTCNADKVTILTYRNGDKEWTGKAFNTAANFKPCRCRLVYLGGVLYIVFPYGQLASYNIVDREFKFESLVVDELFHLNIHSKRKFRAFKLNGELIVIHFDLYENKNVTLPGKPCIKRYDWSNKDWIPVSTLGEKSLLLREKSNQVAIVDKDDMRNNGVVPNKIYQFSDSGCLIKSIEDGELIEFKSIDSNLVKEAGSCDLPEYKYKGGTLFLGTRKAIYWLEPPRGSSEPSLHIFC